MINGIINKYKSFSIQSKSAMWFVACSFFQRGISFITVPIFTRLMTDEQYGTYNIYASWLSILTIICTLNLQYGVLDNAMSKFSEDRDKYISCMQGLTITITTVCFSIYLLLNKQIGIIIGLAPIYIYMMFIEIFFCPALFFWSGRQRFEYRYVKLVLVTIIKSVLNPLLGITLVLKLENKTFGRVFSLVAVEVSICSIIMIAQFIKGRCFFSKKYWKYGLSLALPLIPHYLAGSILNFGDRIVIEKMVGVQYVAYYSVAYSIGMLIQIFTGAINSAITPWIYGRFKSEKYSGISKRVNILLLFVAGLIFSLMMVSPELNSIFGSSNYFSGAICIPPIAASVYFIFLYTILTLVQFFYEKTSFMMVSSIGAALLNVLLNIIAINKFGYVAAAYTTLLCYIVYSYGHYFVSKKVIRKSIGSNIHIFDFKFINSLSVIIVTMSVVSVFLFEYLIVRLSILLILFGIFIFKRKQFMNALSKKHQ